MGMPAGASACENTDCPACRQFCPPCDDGKTWDEITVAISGVVAQQGSVDTDGDTTPESVDVMDISSINGSHAFGLIFFNGAYKSGYDTVTMGEGEPAWLGTGSLGVGACASIWEKTITGLGDFYLGDSSFTDWSDENKWLRNQNIRIRIYSKWEAAAPGEQAYVVTAVVPESGGFTEAQITNFSFDPVTETWHCGSGDYTLDDSNNSYLALQFMFAAFYSLTDTTDEGTGYADNNVSGIPQLITTVNGEFTTSWVLEGTGSRVSAA